MQENDEIRALRKERAALSSQLEEANRKLARLDLLERSFAQQKRQAAGERIGFLAEILKTSPISVITTDEDVRITYVNPAAEELYGYKMEELIGKDPGMLNAEPNADEIQREIVDTINGGGVWRGDILNRKKNGDLFYIHASIYLLADREGNFISLVGFHEDMTDHRRAEERFRQQNEFLMNVIESLNHPFYVIDIDDYTVKMANSAANLGVLSESSTCYALTHRKDRPCDSLEHPCPLEEVKKSGRPVTVEHIHFDKDGNARTAEVHAYPVFDGGGNLIQVIEYCLDITERKRSEEALRQSERRYRELADLLPQVACETDERGNLTFANRNAFDTFGYTQDDFDGGLNVFQMLAPEDRERAGENFRKALSGEQLGGNEYTAIRKDGSTFPVIIYTSTIVHGERPAGVRGIVIDITERKQMEEELRKMQRLESLGVLAGGIAHDFNNILTAILGNISLVRMDPDLDDEISKRLTEAEAASLQAKNLTQQLLTFSQGGAPIKEATLIAGLIEDTAGFALRGANVGCEFRIPGDLWPAEVDGGQISQVINNLVINAKQAMPEGGTIRVRAENTTVGAETGLPLTGGNYIKISIEDHGTGIPPGHLAKIFDPYFTTKQEGSGLGLAISYSIVKGHDGLITVESEMGSGTVFHIYLPASGEDAPAEDAAAKRVFVGSGRVLVMDDEEIVRYVAGEILENVGYEVSFAEDGAEAIEMYREARESGAPFDAVILDLTIPGGMGGRECVRELARMDPEVRAIVSSGYSDDPAMADFRKYGFCGVVPKPYEVDELSETLYRVIQQR